MPSFTFNIKFNRDTSLLITPKQLRETYLFGIDIKDRQGNQISDDALRLYIQAAQDELERYLDIRFHKQLITEDQQFMAEEWIKWGYVRTTYPIRCMIRMTGYLNTTRQTEIPTEWLKNRETSDGETFHRNVYVVPAGEATQVMHNVMFVGIIPNLGYINSQMVPYYWNVAYITGFDKIPSDVFNVVGLMASVNAFFIAGDLIFQPGVSGFSLSIDGLSQSLQSGQKFNDRIRGYVEDIKRQTINLKDRYTGIRLSVA